MGIHESVSEIEKVRKSLVIFAIAFFISIGITILALFNMSFVSNESEISSTTKTLILFFVISVITGIIYLKRNKDFKKLYKDSFVKGILNEVFENVIYRDKPGFSKEQVKYFGLVNMGNIFKSEDYISSNVNGIGFEQSDVVIRDRRHTGKSSYTVTYFVGRMFAFDLPGKTVNRVAVLDKSFKHAPGTFLTNDKVKMESIKFNSSYTIKSPNEHDAFYLLTPQVMEKINRIKAQYGIVLISFVGNKMYMAIPSDRDAFDASIWHAISYPEERAAIMQDAQLIKDVISMIKDLKEI